MRKRNRAICLAANGFTLLEILIAIFILGLVLSTIYAAYSGTLTIIHELDNEARAYRMAQTTLDRMSLDLTSLQRFNSSFSLKGENKTIGSRSFDAIGFWAAAHLSFDEDATSGAPAMIGYFVRRDEEGRYALWRYDVPAAKPSSAIDTDRGVIICERLASFELTYFDESGQNSDSWNTDASSAGQKGKPPRQVQIKLAIVNEKDAEKPHAFMTRVFIPVKK